jgi:hypothetical protein
MSGKSLSPTPKDGITKYLTYDGLVETVGASTSLDSIIDLEILFLTFDEISSSSHQSVFIHTPAIERLALIDNGLAKISGKCNNLHRHTSYLLKCPAALVCIFTINTDLPFFVKCMLSII